MRAARVARAALSALALLVLAPHAMAGRCVALDRASPPADNWAHLAVGSAWGAAVAVATGSTAYGIAAGAAVGAAKEAADAARPGHTCALSDLLLTVAGAAIGAPAGLAIAPTRGGLAVTYTRSW